MSTYHSRKHIFIGGAQRTGTTMLQALICQNPMTNGMIGEASYLRGLVQAYQLGVMSFPNETEDYFESRDALLAFHSNVISSFLSDQFKLHPYAEQLVLKEPHLTKYFPLLHELIPDALFILILRDPRDAIASMINVGERMKLNGEQHFFQDRDMSRLSEYFKSFYLPTVTSTNPNFRNRVCLIRYEDLVNGHEDTYKSLSSFCGLDLPQRPTHQDLDMGKFSALMKSTRYQPWSTGNLGSAPTTSSVGAYRSILSNTEIKAVETSCADIILQHGYQ